uniref:Uncharacterized protein n=1 Tax=Anguilla anguilla TaxID=7936 RepID=A0A0E9WT55_ANGAN
MANNNNNNNNNNNSYNNNNDRVYPLFQSNTDISGFKKTRLLTVKYTVYIPVRFLGKQTPKRTIMTVI